MIARLPRARSSRARVSSSCETIVVITIVSTATPTATMPTTSSVRRAPTLIARRAPFSFVSIASPYRVIGVPHGRQLRNDGRQGADFSRPRHSLVSVRRGDRSARILQALGYTVDARDQGIEQGVVLAARRAPALQEVDLQQAHRVDVR